MWEAANRGLSSLVSRFGVCAGCTTVNRGLNVLFLEFHRGVFGKIFEKRPRVDIKDLKIYRIQTLEGKVGLKDVTDS